MKKLISIIVTLAMIVPMLCMPAHAEEIVTTSDTTVPDVHFPLTKVGDSGDVFHWDGANTSLSISDGVLTAAVNKGSAIYCKELSDSIPTPFEDYRYVVLKMKTLPEDATFSVLVCGTEWYDERNRFSNMKRYDEDGYTYCIFDLSIKTVDEMLASGRWIDGNLKKIRFDSNQSGTYEITDIYISANSPAPEFESFTIEADSDEITDNNGTLTLRPSLKLSNGKKFTDYSTVMWEVNSVNASAEINNDHSLTLTGQMNGSVTAAAYFVYDTIERKAEYTVEISGQPDRVSSKKIKLMTYGNSIHKQEPDSSLGWNGNWGMAASSEDKDYVHQLIRMLGEKYGEENITWVIGSGNGNFENDLSNGTEGQDWTQYLKGLTECAAAEKPDIITVQYGENTRTGNAGYAGTQEGYRDGFIQFVQMLKKGAPDVLVLITTPFWGGDAKINAAKAAASTLNIPIAELAPLTTDENEALDGPDEWSASVKNYPGDLGMLRIAEEMYKKLNIALTGKDNVIYTIQPTAISIIAPSTEITEDSGTVMLTVQAEPDGAANDVVWNSSDPSVAEIDENGVVTAKCDGQSVITATSKYDATLSDTITITVSNQSPLYTVTYDANTTDEVRELPTEDKIKAGKLSIEGKYPLRDEYNFAGWALSADGDVIDSVEITSDTTLYAIWVKAEKWTFERDGYLEGFDVYNGFNVHVQNGILRAYETDYSPVNILKIVSPKLKLDPDEYSSLRIKMKNDSYNADTRLKLNLHTTEGDFDFSYPVNSKDYTEYNADLKNVVGTITGFDFTPTNMDCGVFIDEISFIPATGADKFFIKRIVPENESSKVKNGQQLKIYLNKHVNVSAFDSIAIDNGAVLENKTLSEDGKILCAEITNLKPAKKYTVTISGLKDEDGNTAPSESITFYSETPNVSVYDNSFDVPDDYGYRRADCVSGELSTTDYVTAPSAGIITLDELHDLNFREDEKDIKLRIGKMYALSFYIKAVSGGNVSGMDIVNGDNRSYLKTGIVPSSEWQKVEVIFEASSQDASDIQLGTTKAPSIRTNVANATVKNRRFLIDDIKIEMLPDLEIADTELTNETGTDSEIEVMFSDEISEPVCKIGGEACNIVSVSKNKLVFRPKSPLESGRRYEAEITAKDSNGVSYTFIRNFKTEHYIKPIELKANGQGIEDGLSVARGTVVFTERLENTAMSAATAVFIAAVYDSNGYMKKIVSTKKTISPFDTEDISAEIDLSAANVGDTVKLYLTNNTDLNEIYRDTISLTVK